MHYLHKLFFLIILSGSLLNCSGGGSSGSDPSPSLELQLGTELINNSELADGHVHITFPDASGDLPIITACTVSSSGNDGIADLPDPDSTTYDISSDGLHVYMPTPGDYQITVTVSDPGDSDQDRVINLHVPSSAVYDLSGTVQDGPLGSTTGVRTYVRLYWNPLATPDQLIASAESNASSNGAFTFSNVIGPATHFRVIVESGTH